MRSGRPLKFLGMTLAGWTALRIVLLWPEAPTVGSVARTLVPGLSAAPRAAAFHTPPVAAPSLSPPMTPIAVHRDKIDEARRKRLVALALAGLLRFGEPEVVGGQAAPGSEPSPPLSPSPSPAVGMRPDKRWSLDLWLVARGGSNRGAGFGGGELGGSQAGARFAYALDRSHRLSAFARVASPLAGRGREAAIGIDWQPTAVPIRAVVEERVPLDGGKAAPAAGLVGGFGPVVRHGVRLEGYGQAGIVARHGAEGFADGAVRASRPLGTLAGIVFDLGAGAWGGAQRDAARLDLGPTLGASVPIAGHAIRVAVDWRERVAGHARPGSGPALTIGASF